MKWLRSLFGGSESKPQSELVATFQKAPGNIYVLRVGGVLNKATVDRIQSIAEKDIADGVTELKLLLILDNFRGWKHGDDWGNIDFFAQYERLITRIAVVGDPRWKDETLMFLAAGHRSGAVQFYPPNLEAAARAWLVEA